MRFCYDSAKHAIMMAFAAPKGYILFNYSTPYTIQRTCGDLLEGLF